MRTPFDEANQSFSDRCHELLIASHYCRFFGVSADRIEWTPCRVENPDHVTSLFDGQYGIDYIARVHHPGFKAPFKHLIQERFSRPDYRWVNWATVTEWNPMSNQPSELYKISSGWFVDGCANDEDDPTDFSHLVIFPVCKMLLKLPWMKFERRTNRRTKQPFVRLPWEELHAHGMLDYAYGKPTGFPWFRDIPGGCRGQHAQRYVPGTVPQCRRIPQSSRELPAGVGHRGQQ